MAQKLERSYVRQLYLRQKAYVSLEELEDGVHSLL